MSVSNETSASPAARNPTSARSEAPRLRSSRPATISSTAVSATWLTTSRSPSDQRRAADRGPATCRRAGPPTTLGDDAFSAGSQRRQQSRARERSAGEAEDAGIEPKVEREIAPGSGSGIDEQRADEQPGGRRGGRAPRPPSTSPSMSSCRTSCRRLAPMASRTLISRPRADARASSMPATFAQAISSTSPTTAISPRRRGTAAARLRHEEAHLVVAHGRHPPSSLVCGLRGGELAADERDVGVRLLRRDARPQPALDEHPAHAAPLEPRAPDRRRHDVVDARGLDFLDVRDRQPQLRREQRNDAGERRRRDADDRCIEDRGACSDLPTTPRSLRTRAPTCRARARPPARRPAHRRPRRASGRETAGCRARSK